MGSGPLLPAATVGDSYPNSMASTGDSITRAYNTGWLPFTDNPAASWSTGTNTRRARVLQREVDYNAALAAVCSTYGQCLFDGNAVFATAFTAADVSTRDYFHPSVAGQQKLAAVTWAAGYWP